MSGCTLLHRRKRRFIVKRRHSPPKEETYENSNSNHRPSRCSFRSRLQSRRTFANWRTGSIANGSSSRPTRSPSRRVPNCGPTKRIRIHCRTMKRSCQSPTLRRRAPEQGGDHPARIRGGGRKRRDQQGYFQRIQAPAGGAGFESFAARLWHRTPDSGDPTISRELKRLTAATRGRRWNRWGRHPPRPEYKCRPRDIWESRSSNKRPHLFPSEHP